MQKAVVLHIEPYQKTKLNYTFVNFYGFKSGNAEKTTFCKYWRPP